MPVPDFLLPERAVKDFALQSEAILCTVRQHHARLQSLGFWLQLCWSLEQHPEIKLKFIITYLKKYRGIALLFEAYFKVLRWKG